MATEGKTLVSGLLVATVTVSVFAAAARFGLCHCDDALYLCSDERVMRGLSLSGLKFALADVRQCIWMPLTYLTYMADYTFGWGYGGMHVQNILWHGGAAAVLFLLLRRLFGSPVAAMAGALLWSVHPLRVESVVWLASRKDVVSTFFVLAAALAWLKAGRGAPKWLILSFACAILGAAAKPSAMLFPLLAVALDFLVTGERKPLAVYRAAGAFFLIVAAEAMAIQKLSGAGAYTALVPLPYRLLNALAAVTVYLGNFLWPDQLAPQCMLRYPAPPMWSPLGAAALGALLAALLCGAWKVVRRGVSASWRRPAGDAWSVALAGGGFFLCALVPFLGISGFGFHAFADRFTILPAIGLSLPVAVLLARTRRGAPRILVCALFAVACAGLCGATVRQVAFWESTERLVNRTLEVDGDRNIDAHRALGVYYWEYEHDMEKVHEHLSKAMECSWCEEVREMVGVSCHFLVEACYETGRREEAERYREWCRKKEWRDFKDGPSLEYLMIEANRLLNEDGPDSLEGARKILRELTATAPGNYITANVGYLVARRTGDRDAIRAALEKCAACRGDICCNNVWARRKLEEMR